MIEVEASDDPHPSDPNPAGVEVTMQPAEQFAEQISSHAQCGVIGDRQLLNGRRRGRYGEFPASGGVDYLLLELGQVRQHGYGLCVVHPTIVDDSLRDLTPDNDFNSFDWRRGGIRSCSIRLPRSEACQRGGAGQAGLRTSPV
ncbi:hypothetical protein GCM10017567_56810 [Amycolatopsis bullii]|uniref:Uncharacterized protein n=1 Tax=Amycolatopsis bullii TaxID=941987 RepID=A0ABQ3KLI6_9PSEU|nr:hypothetical protein GCM10017567_56810 [Amycolatopsis bullii]